jgi:RNA-binding protein
VTAPVPRPPEEISVPIPKVLEKMTVPIPKVLEKMTVPIPKVPEKMTAPMPSNPKKQSLMPSSPLRKTLRAAGHRLSPVVQVGKEGLTSAVVQALGEQLLAHELIKVKVGSESPEDRFEVAAGLAALPGAGVVQVIGRIVVLYRRHPYRPRFEPQFATPEPVRPAAKEEKGPRRRRASFGRTGRPPAGRMPREPRPPRGPSGPKAPRERKALQEPRTARERRPPRGPSGPKAAWEPRAPRERKPAGPKRTTRAPRPPRGR